MRRILLVMDDCGAGDALRLSPYVAALRLAFPDARVAMIAGPGAAEVYRDSASVDALVESHLYRRDLAPWAVPFWKAAELSRLAASSWPRHDLVIVFWWGSRTLATLARVLCRGKRVGFGRPGAFTTSLGSYDFDADEMEQNWLLLDASGLTRRPVTRPVLEVPPQAEESALNLLRENGWDGRSPTVVLHPGSDWACQRWVPERWSEVADAIHAETGALIVLTGTGSERHLVDAIRSRMTAPSVSLAGLTPLVDLAAVIRLATLTVTVDSAAYVVARSQGTPVVVLAGASHPERLAGSAPAVVVRRMTELRAREVNEHRRHAFAEGGCQEGSCPFAGLTELAPGDVLEGVRQLLPAAAVRAAL